jgi:hypothetical protein
MAIAGEWELTKYGPPRLLESVYFLVEKGIERDPTPTLSEERPNEAISILFPCI